MKNSLASCRGASPLEARESAEREARCRFIMMRHRLGWSQLVASQHLGVARSALENWERGETRLPLWALVLLEKAAA